MASSLDSDPVYAEVNPFHSLESRGMTPQTQPRAASSVVRLRGILLAGLMGTQTDIPWLEGNSQTQVLAIRVLMNRVGQHTEGLGGGAKDCLLQVAPLIASTFQFFLFSQQSLPTCLLAAPCLGHPICYLPTSPYNLAQDWVRGTPIE